MAPLPLASMEAAEGLYSNIRIEYGIKNYESHYLLRTPPSFTLSKSTEDYVMHNNYVLIEINYGRK